MFGIGTGELLLILVIGMLVVGPERMVSFARRAGELLAKFREQTDDVTRDFREAFEEETGELASLKESFDALNPNAMAQDLKDAFSLTPKEGDKAEDAPSQEPPAVAESAKEQDPAPSPSQTAAPATPEPEAIPELAAPKEPEAEIAMDGEAIEISVAEFVTDDASAEAEELLGPELVGIEEAPDSDTNEVQS